MLPPGLTIPAERAASQRSSYEGDRNELDDRHSSENARNSQEGEQRTSASLAFLKPPPGLQIPADKISPRSSCHEDGREPRPSSRGNCRSSYEHDDREERRGGEERIYHDNRGFGRDCIEEPRDGSCRKASMGNSIDSRDGRRYEKKGEERSVEDGRGGCSDRCSQESSDRGMRPGPIGQRTLRSDFEEETRPEKRTYSSEGRWERCSAHLSSGSEAAWDGTHVRERDDEREYRQRHSEEREERMRREPSYRSDERRSDFELSSGRRITYDERERDDYCDNSSRYSDYRNGERSRDRDDRRDYPTRYDDEREDGRKRRDPYEDERRDDHRDYSSRYDREQEAMRHETSFLTADQRSFDGRSQPDARQKREMREEARHSCERVNHPREEREATRRSRQSEEPEDAIPSGIGGGWYDTAGNYIYTNEDVVALKKKKEEDRILARVGSSAIQFCYPHLAKTYGCVAPEVPPPLRKPSERTTWVEGESEWMAHHYDPLEDKATAFDDATVRKWYRDGKITTSTLFAMKYKAEPQCFYDQEYLLNESDADSPFCGAIDCLRRESEKDIDAHKFREWKRELEFLMEQQARIDGAR
ncbi:hypothetical protein PMAYCL1PPCAC_08566 [Pristionchus mayeri]|uniref:Uncharacterized protein n=1 Tax=Pristionchus mayeri TaxID=1317129 RepID=A0AAN4ZCP1_9BILA|nr:hypothetical protein PMAYCL1PPCAC_08566 [Pristionchus mayeri]